MNTAGALALLGIACLGVLLLYPGSMPSGGELLFLLPAFAAVATTCWLSLERSS